MAECVTTSRDARRHFWTTQPAACGVETTESCSGTATCSRPGLALQPVYDDCDAQQLGCYIGTPESVAAVLADYYGAALPALLEIDDAFGVPSAWGYPPATEAATAEIADAFSVLSGVFLDPMSCPPDNLTIEDAFGVPIAYAVDSAGNITPGRLPRIDPAALCMRPPRRLVGATIATNDFVKSLALNILLTDAPPDAVNGCPAIPGRRGGYWADDYRDDGLTSGTNLRDIPAAGRIEDLRLAIEQRAAASLQKIVSYGVASSISTTAAYLGGGAFSLLCEIDGATFSLSGTQAADTWFWSS